jgi:predicted DNA-binding transcriptional regulator AlpA
MAVSGFDAPSSFYAAQNREHDPLPRPVHPTPGTSAWVEEELRAWVARRIAERDGPAAPLPDLEPHKRRRGRPPGAKNKPKLQEIRADGA